MRNDRNLLLEHHQTLACTLSFCDKSTTIVKTKRLTYDEYSYNKRDKDKESATNYT
jgi:hypothetical protein